QLSARSRWLNRIASPARGASNIGRPPSWVTASHGCVSSTFSVPSLAIRNATVSPVSRFATTVPPFDSGLTRPRAGAAVLGVRQGRTRGHLVICTGRDLPVIPRGDRERHYLAPTKGGTMKALRFHGRGDL